MFAEFERALIRERQMEGIAAAKKRGVYTAGSGWSELVSKRTAADNNNNRMRPQGTCHAIGAYPPLTGGSRDLEAWRPEIWDSAVWWQSRCNW